MWPRGMPSIELSEDLTPLEGFVSLVLCHPDQRGTILPIPGTKAIWLFIILPTRSCSSPAAFQDRTYLPFPPATPAIQHHDVHASS
jgi:hypothetical protein